MSGEGAGQSRGQSDREAPRAPDDDLEADDAALGADAASPSDGDDDDAGELRRWTRRARRARDDRDDEAERLGERLTQQLAAQWALIRAERERRSLVQPLPIEGGQSNLKPAQVPWGLDVAAAWAWRFLVITAAAVLLIVAFWKIRVVTVPVMIALLITALGSPVVTWGRRLKVPAALSAAVVVIGGLGIVGLLLTFVSQSIIDGASDLADQVVVGLGEVRTWLRDGPLNATDSQIDGYIKQVQNYISSRGQDDAVVAQVTEVGFAIGHFVAGFFIAIFAAFFFLYDGERIWSWSVRLAPRAARELVDSSGRVAWVSLTQFMRATVLVAAVDAIGIMLVAWLLDVPFVLAIGVLVFLGAFVPLVGATVAGGVAVLVALVDQGPWTALLMLGGVILVQQIEGNVLQPFLMGRFVSVHPLGVLLAIGVGVLVGGIVGALLAVPLVAAINAVVLHLSEAADLVAEQPDPDGTDPPPGAGASGTSADSDQDDDCEFAEDPGAVGDFGAIGGRPGEERS